MYNMDNPIMFTELNEESIRILIHGKYLKEEPIGSTPKCRYLSSGDLTGKGVVYCEYHGSREYGLGNEYEIAPSEAYYRDEARKEFERKIYSFAPILLTLGVISVIIVSLPSKKKKS